MKLQLNAESLRLRLSQTEVARLDEIDKVAASLECRLGVS
jgi:hypothetical protein